MPQHSIYRVASGQGKVREIHSQRILELVREQSGDFIVASKKCLKYKIPHNNRVKMHVLLKRFWKKSENFESLFDW